MKKRDWKLWFEAAGVRALKAMAEAALGYIGGAMLMSDVNWLGCLSAACIGGIVSLLFSIKGLPELEDR